MNLISIYLCTFILIDVLRDFGLSTTAEEAGI